jgi:hypothetical protein
MNRHRRFLRIVAYLERYNWSAKCAELVATGNLDPRFPQLARDEADNFLTPPLGQYFFMRYTPRQAAEDRRHGERLAELAELVESARRDYRGQVATRCQRLRLFIRETRKRLSAYLESKQ